mmetsp:Transcript_7650/g.19494  ORF Transcript_7650/g.19494 Transcript_7650/m.19494 type:complete len:1162 (-) Transcript_7650:210-3695(-)
MRRAIYARLLMLHSSTRGHALGVRGRVQVVAPLSAIDLDRLVVVTRGQPLPGLRPCGRARVLDAQIVVEIPRSRRLLRPKATEHRLGVVEVRNPPKVDGGDLELGKVLLRHLETLGYPPAHGPLCVGGREHDHERVPEVIDHRELDVVVEVAHMHQPVVGAHFSFLHRHLLCSDRPVLIVDVLDHLVVGEHLIDARGEELEHPKSLGHGVHDACAVGGGQLEVHLLRNHFERLADRCFLGEQQVEHLRLLALLVVPRDLEALLRVVLDEGYVEHLVVQRVARLLERHEHLEQLLNAAVLERLRLGLLRVAVVHRESHVRRIAANRTADSRDHVVVRHALIHLQLDGRLALADVRSVAHLRQLEEVHRHAVLDRLEEVRDRHGHGRDRRVERADARLAGGRVDSHRRRDGGGGGAPAGRLGDRQRLEDDDVAVLQLRLLERFRLDDPRERHLRLELHLLIHFELDILRKAPQRAQHRHEAGEAVAEAREVRAHEGERLLERVEELDEEEDVVGAQHRVRQRDVCIHGVDQSSDGTGAHGRRAVCVGVLAGCGEGRRRRDAAARVCRRWLRVLYHLEVQPNLRLRARVHRHRGLVLLEVHDRCHLIWVLLLQRLVGTERLVLPVDPQPEALLVHGHVELALEHSLQVGHGLLLLDPEARHLVVVDQVEEGLVADLRLEVGLSRHLHHSVQMRLVALLALAHLVDLLALQLRAQVRHDVAVAHLAVELGDRRLADVHEHVRTRHLWTAAAIVAANARRERARARVGGGVVAVRALDRLARGDARHALVVELVPLVRVLRAKRRDEDPVVASIWPARVHEHRVELVVVARVRVGVVGEVLAAVGVEVKPLRKLEARVHLHHLLRREVELEAQQVQLEHGRQRLEPHALLRVLLPKLVRHVLVLAVEELLGNILVERLVDVLPPLHRELQVVERLLAPRLVLHVDALDVVGELALEEVRHRPLDRRALHLLLELVDEDAVQLLHVVLHESIRRVPAEGFGQLLRRHRRVRVLQLIEDALQREWDRRLRVLLLPGRHVVHRLAEEGDVLEGLQQRVHVARGALVLQPHEPRLLLRIEVLLRLPRHLDRALDLECARAAEEATPRVAHVFEGDELAEPPVVRAGVEDVVRFFRHRAGCVELIAQRQREVSLARPVLRELRPVSHVQVH